MTMRTVQLAGPSASLPPLNVTLLIAAVVLLITGGLSAGFGRQLDAADNRWRRRAGNTKTEHGRNRRVGLIFIAIGAVSLIAGLITTLAG